ncbi:MULTISPECIES: hypothetical protein [Cetobacterium]|uniref:Uncharacterized protein n=1 Tax=Cetobacterium somerae ATCC BAA-474 TaxID=1319815 RepID=U7V9Q4_9FUSO|nr:MULTISPECIES: hypothetical protein [Cetobacterium]ERT68211.1 hypothetical protein HMPREF0202_01921 [Cetobacterium somerae ATCC BAA-474]MBC2852267.1 hypothetical protein [Cetobacterium sp. 2G large]MCQ9628130.1 hypothetical protein [Cetobacterium somerae]WVJ03270.1 hypothetical protein VSU16_15465 [Cetobacterium somerae]
MLYIIFIIIIIVVVFFHIKNSKFKSNIKSQNNQKTISTSKKVTSKTLSSTKQEELELSKNYKKIIFFSLSNNIDITSDILYISAIKIGFNLKTGEIIYLEELKNTNNLQEFKNFSKDTSHFVSYNTKLYNHLLNLGAKIQFCTMLTNVSTVGIKNSHGRNRWPKLFEISKYYGIKFNNNLNLNTLNNIKLNIQIFQKMLKHPKTSIIVRDFIFNNKSFLDEL